MQLLITLLPGFSASLLPVPLARHALPSPGQICCFLTFQLLQTPTSLPLEMTADSERCRHRPSLPTGHRVWSFASDSCYWSKSPDDQDVFPNFPSPAMPGTSGVFLCARGVGGSYCHELTLWPGPGQRALTALWFSSLSAFFRTCHRSAKDDTKGRERG